MSMDLGDVGTAEAVNEQLAEYPGLFGGLFSNETDALLSALLMEARAARTGMNPALNEENRDTSNIPGTYATFPAVPEAGEWLKLEPGFVTSEIDIRSQDAIDNGHELHVGFTRNRPSKDKLNEPSEVIKYRPKDFPVTGIDVSTGVIWLRVPESAGVSNAVVYVEAWG